MTRNELKRMSLGIQGLFVQGQLDEDERRRYLNYLIQAVQLKCPNMHLNIITLDMANNLLEIIHENDELFHAMPQPEEVKK